MKNKYITWEITKSNNNIVVINVFDKATKDNISEEYELIFPEYTLGYHYIDSENIQIKINKMIEELVIRGI